ncbi:unnamed protein product, partial [Laminaria digitata]
LSLHHASRREHEAGTALQDTSSEHGCGQARTGPGECLFCLLPGLLVGTGYPNRTSRRRGYDQRLPSGRIEVEGKASGSVEQRQQQQQHGFCGG